MKNTSTNKTRPAYVYRDAETHGNKTTDEKTARDWIKRGRFVEVYKVVCKTTADGVQRTARYIRTAGADVIFICNGTGERTASGARALKWYKRGIAVKAIEIEYYRAGNGRATARAKNVTEMDINRDRADIAGRANGLLFATPAGDGHEIFTNKASTATAWYKEGKTVRVYSANTTTTDAGTKKTRVKIAEWYNGADRNADGSIPPDDTPAPEQRKKRTEFKSDLTKTYERAERAEARALKAYNAYLDAYKYATETLDTEKSRAELDATHARARAREIIATLAREDIAPEVYATLFCKKIVYDKHALTADANINDIDARILHAREDAEKLYTRYLRKQQRAEKIRAEAGFKPAPEPIDYSTINARSIFSIATGIAIGKIKQIYKNSGMEFIYKLYVQAVEYASAINAGKIPALAENGADCISVAVTYLSQFIDADGNAKINPETNKPYTPRDVVERKTITTAPRTMENIKTKYKNARARAEKAKKNGDMGTWHMEMHRATTLATSYNAHKRVTTREYSIAINAGREVRRYIVSFERDIKSRVYLDNYNDDDNRELWVPEQWDITTFADAEQITEMIAKIKLTPEQQRVLYLRLDGIPVNDEYTNSPRAKTRVNNNAETIARVTGISKSNVYNILHAIQNKYIKTFGNPADVSAETPTPPAPRGAKHKTPRAELTTTT